MKWSKLRKLIEDGFAPSVRGRVHFYSTAYGCRCGRGWVTIDGTEIADLSTILSGNIHGAVYHEATKTKCSRHPGVAMEDRTPGATVERGEFSRFDLHEACWEYVHDLGPERGLTSANPLVVALAVLSSKVEARRLKALAGDADLHPLARRLLDFRLNAEAAA